MNIIDVTAAVIFNDDGKVLIAKRKLGKSLENHWEFPGGNIEGGENTKIHYEKANSSTMKSVEKNLEKLVKAHIDMDFAPNPWLGRAKPGVPLEEQTLKCNWCDYKADCSFWSLTDEYLDEIMEDEKNE